jgi:hypothetical protein
MERRISATKRRHRAFAGCPAVGANRDGPRGPRDEVLEAAASDAIITVLPGNPAYSIRAYSYRGCLVTFWAQSVSAGSASVGVM